MASTSEFKALAAPSDLRETKETSKGMDESCCSWPGMKALMALQSEMHFWMDSSICVSWDCRLSVRSEKRVVERRLGRSTLLPAFC